ARSARCPGSPVAPARAAGVFRHPRHFPASSSHDEGRRHFLHYYVLSKSCRTGRKNRGFPRRPVLLARLGQAGERKTSRFGPKRKSSPVGSSTPMLFQLIAFVAAAIAGGIGSIAGFGIGSILTPLVAGRLGTKPAVAAVSFPHLAGTLLRFWFIRKHVDRRVLLTFGISSAAGGLAGAWLQVWFKSAVLGYVLGALLVFAGVMGLTGLACACDLAKEQVWSRAPCRAYLAGWWEIKVASAPPP